MTAAAFRATYSDWKVIKGRKVVQVVFEVPIESADLAYQVVGGMPHPGTEAWFGIAKLDPRQQQEEQAASSKTPVPTAQPRQPNPAGAPSYAQRLGIACGKPSFWRFLEEQKLQAKPYAKIACDDEAADVVRFLLDVKSRSETVVGTPAGNRADALLSEYTAWELT